MAKLKNETKSSETIHEEKSIQIIDFTIDSQSIDLNKYKVGTIDTVFYVPDYISRAKQDEILALVHTLPNADWVHLPHAKRRLQKLGGDVTERGLTNISTLPSFLRKLADKLANDKAIDKVPNHVLLNDYGYSSGIMPHTDGPLYYPQVCVLSFGSGCILKFFLNYQEYKNGNPICSLYCEPGSLYIFRENAYNDYLHAIDDSTTDEILVSLMVKDDIVEDISGASVENYKDLECLKNMLGRSVQSLVEDRRLGKVEKNERYNYVAFFPRHRRLSLTIRYVPEAN